MLSYFLRVDPQLVESLIDVLKNGPAIPLDVQVLTLKTLRKLSQVCGVPAPLACRCVAALTPARAWLQNALVTTRMKDLGVLQDGLIPSLVQHCLSSLGSSQNQGDSAPFVRLTESLLGVVEQLVSSPLMHRTLRCLRAGHASGSALSVLPVQAPPCSTLRTPWSKWCS